MVIVDFQNVLIRGDCVVPVFELLAHETDAVPKVDVLLIQFESLQSIIDDQKSIKINNQYQYRPFDRKRMSFRSYSTFDRFSPIICTTRL